MCSYSCQISLANLRAFLCHSHKYIIVKNTFDNEQTYLGCLMATSSASSGGTSNISGSSPCADTTMGSTSKRPPFPRQPSAWHTYSENNQPSIHTKGSVAVNYEYNYIYYVACSWAYL